MKRLLLLFSIVFVGNVLSQNTLVPDANFEQILINYGYDSGIPDGSVPTANINTITSLNVDYSSISDLTGIEDFAALSILSCYSNLLTSLDVSQNTSLTILACDYNQIGALDVSQNLALEVLICASNQLTYLNVAQNSGLTTFECDNNNLECLNVKNGNNTNCNFNASSNPSLTCITVDDAAWSTANWTQIDAQSSFSSNCANLCVLGIEEEMVNADKQLIKIVDLMGRECSAEKNKVLIYVYSDGTTERVFEFE